jgi:hypothetical protein
MMITFNQFLKESTLITEGIRQGLPHILTMHHDDFHNLLKSGRINMSRKTEKTDGSTHIMGWDKDGFYTQSSGSGNDKMRASGDYAARATRRSQESGKPLDLTGSNMFDHVHDTLSKNKKLMAYLKTQAAREGGETKLRSELFYSPYGRPSEDKAGEVKFVGTSYDPSHIGQVGKMVIHSQLPDNRLHNIEAVKKTGNNDINFDDDMIDTPPTAVDVSDERDMMKGINRDLLNSRTVPKNKEAKAAETAKLDEIRKRVSDKVDTHIKSLNISPKWGSGSEGVVIHPPEGSDQPRFKATSEGFKKYKAEQKVNPTFKTRNAPNA